MSDQTLTSLAPIGLAVPVVLYVRQLLNSRIGELASENKQLREVNEKAMAQLTALSVANAELRTRLEYMGKANAVIN